MTTLVHLASSLLMNAPSSSGRHLHRLDPLRHELFANLFAVKCLVHFGIELRDDRCRRIRRSHDRDPGHAAKARIAELGDGRDIGCSAQAFGAADCERAQLALLDEWKNGDRRFEHHVHLATDQIGQRRRTALVRNVRHVDAGGATEHFHHQMVGHAAAARCVVDRLRLGFRRGNQLFKVRCRKGRVGYQHQRHDRDACDRSEILDRIVGQLRIQPGIDCQRSARADQQRIAVRRRQTSRLASQ